MKRLTRVLALAALFLSTAAAAAPSPQEIVAAADKVRNPGVPFSLTNTLVEYIGGQPRDRVVLQVLAKEDPKTQEYKNLVRYVDPPRDLGKMVLMNGTSMWFYDPSSKASVRISPQQRLMGQASDGDVMTANLARDYTAKLLGEETLEDADRHNRRCWHLDLTAATPEAVYSRIEYWVEEDSNDPVKGKFYSDSGRLLKIAYYHKFAEQLGVQRPTETIIIDAVDQNLVTTMTSSGMTARTIPDSWFQREYLPHVTGE